MKLLWTLVRVVITLAILIPVSVFAMGTAIAVFGTLVGLAAVAIGLAVLGLVAHGAFRLAARLLRPKRSHTLSQLPQLKSEDPYYTAALRELDRELSGPTR